MLTCSGTRVIRCIGFCRVQIRAICRSNSRRGSNWFLNPTTARALGLRVPESFLLRVDDVVE